MTSLTKEETLRLIVDAFNRRELDDAAVLAHFDEEVEVVPLRAAIEDIRYRGHAGVAQFQRESFEIWDDVKVQLEEVRAVGDRFVLFGRLVTEGGRSGVRTELATAVLAEFRGDRVSLLRTYTSPELAMSDATEGL